METIQGTVKSIIFENKESGFKVLKIKTTKGPQLTITGEFGPEIIVKTVADFHGQYKEHPKYGTNFRVSGYHIIHNVEELASIQLFLGCISENIGLERASLIVSHFGSNTIKILDNEPDRLTEIEGIGKISANSLKEAWIKNRKKWEEERQQYSLRAFLNSLGIKERRVKKILRYFGGGLNAEEVIRENPYKLTEIESFGFSTADFIAQKLGLPESSPFRFEAFILYSLNVICNQIGHLYLNKNDLLKIINKFCRENGTSFIGVRELNENDLDKTINNLQNQDKIINDEGDLYSKFSYHSEMISASKIVKILQESSDLIFLNEDAINKHIENFEREYRITLSEKQKVALHYLISKKVFIITGGPGTGKTQVLKAIVEIIKKLKLRLTCLAPTGISAKKMSNTINFEASTIHRGLGFRGFEWTYNENNKYDTDIVILDEASMICQDVFYRLLSALERRVHIIFVGDDNQLPSVSAGNVLRELINCNEIPVVRFNKIFRQEEASDIIKVAHRIKNGDSDLSSFKRNPKADVCFIREKNLDIIENFLIKIALKFKDEKRAFQIISPRNQGPLSVDNLNNSLQNILNPTNFEKECSLGKFIIRRGDRVIIIKNDYELNVFNGEIGKVTNISGGFITVNFIEKEVKISIEEAIEKLKLAYALTVHKIQGQEYPYIILPFINQYGKNMLQRNLLYTAITRAKKKVIIIGHGSAIEKAIENSSVHKRNTKLGKRIKKCLNKVKSSSQTLHGELVDYLPAKLKEAL